MSKLFPSLVVLTFLAACAGMTPTTTGQARTDLGALIIAARIETPNGRAYSGGVTLNLLGIGKGSSESYRRFLPARRTLLYQIKPGLYRLQAPLDFFGNSKGTLPIRTDNERYSPSFPKDLAYFPPCEIKAEKTTAIGHIRSFIMPVPQGVAPNIKIKFNHDLAARRRLIESVISSMGNPDIPEAERKSYQSWARSLEQALTSISALQRQPFSTPEPQQ